MTEQELAATVVAWLRADEWDVYQEVEIPGGRVDIVAVRGRVRLAIETKLGCGFKLFEQIFNASRHAHFASIAVPSMKISSLARRICRDYGIGILHVGAGNVSRFEDGRLNRRPLDMTLREEQKRWGAAGNEFNMYYTAFRGTKEALYRFALENQGCELSLALASIQHHYSNARSARSSMKTWIETGKVPGLRLERDGKTLRLYAGRRTKF